MKLLILSSHSVLEYDDLRMFSDLGYDVFMPGGYADPSHPGEALRPPLPDVPHHPELEALCHAQRVKHEGQDGGYPIIDFAKADLHPDLVDWADVIMVNCFPVEWLGPQWQRLRGKRVIWRTIGQSNPTIEQHMRHFRGDGLQIVRYSPAEKRAFEPMGVFAGEDAVIRFAKYPGDYGPWTGEEAVVGHLAQHDRTPHARDEFLNWGFFEEATNGLPVSIAGPNSDLIGGLGALSWDDMRAYLSRIRVMLYTGTQPASYTLGLMEAMLTGVPVVSIGPERMWLPALFEGHEIAYFAEDDPAKANSVLAALLEGYHINPMSRLVRQRGLDLFSYDAVGPQWLDFLGAPVTPRELVAA